MDWSIAVSNTKGSQWIIVPANGVKLHHSLKNSKLACKAVAIELKCDKRLMQMRTLLLYSKIIYLQEILIKDQKNSCMD